MSQSRQYVAQAPAPLVAAGSPPAGGPGTAVAPGQPAPAPSPTAATAEEVSSPTVDTPRRLRRLTTALILVGLLFGLAGALSFGGLATDLDHAEANTAQLIRVQQIQTNLLSADATATNAFLVGGLEPAQQRATYDQAISTSTALIAQAADAQPADAAALTALNQDVVDYAVAIEQARANNRQGFPVGAQYLRNASTGLRTDALPILDQLVSANADRAADAMTSKIELFFEIVGLLCLAALVLGTVWVARRFKRRINVGLVTASAVLLVVWLASVLVFVSVGQATNRIAEVTFRDVNSAADVRIQGYNAKSNESLTLIARGSGGSFERAWADAATDVDAQLGRLSEPDLTRAWRGYVATHRQIRKLDDSGSWDAAVKQATGGGATSSNARFGQFDTSVTRTLDSVSQETSQGLAASRPLLVVFAILTFLGGLGAALLARWGIAARLKEYR